jgi:Zn-dependent M28 family amino/carboxypeptidase
MAVLCLFFSFTSLSCSEKPQFNSQRAFDDLVAQCDFGPRVPNTDSHERAAEFLFNSLKATTDLCRKQEFTYFDSLTGQTLNLLNIIASYDSGNQRRVMLCAHWDSRPRSEKDTDSSKQNLPILGANDGASGVAVLLELGRLFENSPPPVGVDIVLFDGEDYGLNGQQEGWLLGSQHFARRLGTYRPRFAILLDMIGDRDLQIYREGYSDDYAGDLTDYVWKIARKSAPEFFVDSVKDTIYDDHVSLLVRRVKAIDIIDFDYPYWHTQADTPDKCSPQSLAVVGRVLIDLLWDEGIKKF